MSNSSEQSQKRFPELYDLVSVSAKSVEYYGYIDDIEYDLRCPRVCIEFYPGNSQWFDMSEVKMMNYPTAKP